MFSVYLESIGFSYSTIGIILGAYGVTQILFRFPLGILTDRLYNMRKQLLMSSFVCAFLSCLIMIYFETFIFVLIARLLAGITASMWVMATVLYSYYFSPDKASRAMGTMQFNTVMTQFLCMTTSGILVHLFGWNFPFWLGAIASLLGIYFSWKIKDVAEEVKDKIPLNIKDYLRRTHAIGGLKMLTFLSLVAHAILFITVFGFSQMKAFAIGVEEQQFAWLMGAFFIPHALTSLSLMVFDVDPKYNRILLISSFCFTSVFLALIPFGHSLFTLSLYHAGLGLTLGFVFPLLLSEVVKVSPEELKMSAMGYYQSFYAIGILIGPLFAGVIADEIGLNEVFTITAILTLISTSVLFIGKPKRKTNEQR